MRLKATVIMPTNRYGWLENTFRALGRQTFPKEEWEFVLVDDYGDRWDEVKKLAEENGVRTKYMHSKPAHWKTNRQIANARNTGLIYADSELIIFFDDYMWVPPEWVGSHWGSYCDTRGATVARVKAARYKRIVLTGAGLEVMGDDERCDKTRFKSPSQQEIASWFYTFNTSAPLYTIVDINGFDEEFDATSEEDIDLGLRLYRSGVRFVFLTHESITAYHLQHGGEVVEVRCNRCGGEIYIGDLHCWNHQKVMPCPKCGSMVDRSEIARKINMPARYSESECHRVTKDMYKTKYDGSWGLLERNARKPPWDVNYPYFNLERAREERERYDKLTGVREA